MEWEWDGSTRWGVMHSIHPSCLSSPHEHKQTHSHARARLVHLSQTIMMDRNGMGTMRSHCSSLVGMSQKCGSLTSTARTSVPLVLPIMHRQGNLYVVCYRIIFDLYYSFRFQIAAYYQLKSSNVSICSYTCSI